MKNKDWGLFIIRLGLGILFLVAGFGKITGIAGFAAAVWGSLIIAWLVALGEFLGGISLIVGKLTKWSTLGLAIIMIGAIFIVAIPNVMGNSSAIVKLLEDTAVLTSLIGIMIIGPGKISMDKY